VHCVVASVPRFSLWPKFFWFNISDSQRVWKLSVVLLRVVSLKLTDASSIIRAIKRDKTTPVFDPLFGRGWVIARMMEAIHIPEMSAKFCGATRGNMSSGSAGLHGAICRQVLRGYTGKYVGQVLRGYTGQYVAKFCGPTRGNMSPGSAALHGAICRQVLMLQFWFVGVPSFCKQDFQACLLLCSLLPKCTSVVTVWQGSSLFVYTTLYHRTWWYHIQSKYCCTAKESVFFKVDFQHTS
jgi:hypothetical protein